MESKGGSGRDLLGTCLIMLGIHLKECWTVVRKTGKEHQDLPEKFEVNVLGDDELQVTLQRRDNMTCGQVRRVTGVGKDKSAIINKS